MGTKGSLIGVIACLYWPRLPQANDMSERFELINLDGQKLQIRCIPR